MKSLQILSDAARTEDMQHFDDVIHGLPFPTAEADQMLLRMAAESPKSAKVVGKYAVHRMVLGPKGFGDLNDKIRMDFAEPMLKLNMDRKLISYLGKIHEARPPRPNVLPEKGVSHAAEARYLSRRPQRPLQQRLRNSRRNPRRHGIHGSHPPPVEASPPT